jgi:hypothetical protein
MMEEMDECLMNQVNYTEITHTEPETLHKYKLDDLFLNFDSIPEEHRRNNIFKVRFYAVRCDPQD